MSLEISEETEYRKRVIICPAGRKMHATKVGQDLAILSKGPLIIKKGGGGKIIEKDNVRNLVFLRPVMEPWNEPFKCPNCPIEDKRCQITFPAA